MIRRSSSLESPHDHCIVPDAKSSVDSHTPYPYQLCYCSSCRKTAGGGGFAINLMGDKSTLKVSGEDALGLVAQKLEQMKTEMIAWEALSRSTSFT